MYGSVWLAYGRCMVEYGYVWLCMVGLAYEAKGGYIMKRFLTVFAMDLHLRGPHSRRKLWGKEASRRAERAGTFCGITWRDWKGHRNHRGPIGK